MKSQISLGLRELLILLLLIIFVIIVITLTFLNKEWVQLVLSRLFQTNPQV